MSAMRLGYNELLNMLEEAESRNGAHFGFRRQPGSEDLASILASLPVVDIDLSCAPTEIDILLSRPLDASEAYRLGFGMHADEPEDITDGTLEICLWWR